MLGPGDTAPDFELPCALAGRASTLRLRDLRSDFIAMFFYPRDFSFICPTEVIGFHKARAAFAAESTTIVGVSVDDAETHRRWARELGGLAYPLLADEGGKVARAFGVLDEAEKVALRATFILDPKRIILYAVASPVNVGRSVGETLRVVRALRSGKLCPADWEPGTNVEPTDAKY
jgi:peroxiredoxin (alkyl hydroperoxide reductase subunit C)